MKDKFLNSYVHAVCDLPSVREFWKEHKIEIQRQLIIEQKGTSRGIELAELISCNFELIQKFTHSIDRSAITEKVTERLIRLYEKNIRSNKNIMKNWSDYYNLRVCPYCLASFTRKITRKKGNPELKYEVDHFFNKRDNPYFAISIHNLIPSCYSCNRFKKNKNFSHNPLDLFDKKPIVEIDILSYMKLIYKIGESDKVELVLNVEDPDIKKHYENNVGIKLLWEENQDEIKDLIEKAYIYNSVTIKSILEFSDDLFNQYELVHKIFKIDFDADNILNKPLAKLEWDIAIDLGIID